MLQPYGVQTETAGTPELRNDIVSGTSGAGVTMGLGASVVLRPEAAMITVANVARLDKDRSGGTIDCEGCVLTGS